MDHVFYLLKTCCSSIQQVTEVV